MKKTINRRNFLKWMSGVFMGILLLPLEKLIKKTSPNSTEEMPSSRKAMFYKSSDHLAG